MKLICIIGSSVQKTLLPLLQYQDQFSSVVFIAPKHEFETLSYILTFLEDRKHWGGSDADFSIETEIISNSPEYDDFYEKISAILWKSFADNDPTVLNVSGGTAHMILAGVNAARDMKIPVMYVDSNKLNIQIIEWGENGAEETVHREHLDLGSCSMKDILALCNFYPTYLIPDELLPGIQYERWVYTFFQTAKDEGLFDSIDRNIILTWNRDTQKKNEIDIVFLRNQTIGFVSIKSGKSVQAKPNFDKMSKELKDIYPQWLLKLPCLRILISKHMISAANRNTLSQKGILVFDRIQNDENVVQAIQTVIRKADSFHQNRTMTGEKMIEQFSEGGNEQNDFI